MWDSPALINLTNLTRVARHRWYRATSFPPGQNCSAGGEHLKRLFAREYPGQPRGTGSEEATSEPTGRSGERRVIGQRTKTSIRRTAGGDPVEQTIKPNSEQPGRKRNDPVVILLTIERNQCSGPEGPERLETGPEAKIQLPETLVGHTRGKGPPVGSLSEQGARPCDAPSGGGRLPGQVPDDFIPKIGSEEKPLPLHTGHRTAEPRARLRMFHKHKISKKRHTETSGTKPSRQGMTNPWTRSATDRKLL